MSYNADEAVISGQCYNRRRGQRPPPVALTDFTGDVCMTLLLTGRRARWWAQAHRAPPRMPFGSIRRTPARDGKDVRVWTVTIRGGPVPGRARRGDLSVPAGSRVGEPADGVIGGHHPAGLG